MQYNRDGFPKLKRITPRTCFADVFITIRELGYDLGKGPKQDSIHLSRTIDDDGRLHYRWESHYITLDDLPDFLNLEMEEEGLIRKEDKI